MYRLRELERQDMKTINGWRNNSEVISLLGAPFRYINLEVDENWFDSYMKNRNNCVRCAILDDDVLIGLVSLTGIDMLNRSAEFHIMIGDTGSQNKGAGTFATEEMLRHAFDNMNLNRIMLTVLEDNERALHMYEKVGFIKEGTMRSVYYKGGTYVNAIICSILHEEYNAKILRGGITL